jgi:hypothetical protein
MKSNLISTEIILACIGFAIAGFVAWSDVKSDIAVNEEAITQNKDQNTERYKDLKKGQESIRELLEQVLLKQVK